MVSGNVCKIRKARERFGYKGLPRKGAGNTIGCTIGCKKILQQHRDLLKDDPEHLPTKFIADIVGCNCKILKQKP